MAAKEAPATTLGKVATQCLRFPGATGATSESVELSRPEFWDFSCFLASSAACCSSAWRWTTSVAPDSTAIAAAAEVGPADGLMPMAWDCDTGATGGTGASGCKWIATV